MQRDRKINGPSQGPPPKPAELAATLAAVEKKEGAASTGGALASAPAAAAWGAAVGGFPAVPAPAAASGSNSAPTFFVGGDQILFHGFDLAAEEGRRALVGCVQGNFPAAVEALAGKEFELANAVAVARRDYDHEAGSEVTYPFEVLVLAGGSRYTCGSRGVLRSLMLFSAAFGPPPWNPPLKVRLKVIRTATGRSWHFLELCEEAGVNFED